MTMDLLKGKTRETIDDIFADAVRKYPEQIAISDGGEEVTYHALYGLKQGFAQYLREDLRVQKGQRIALFLPNCVEFVSLFFAVADIGAIAVPLNFHLKEKELQYYLDKCGITVVVTSNELVAQWGNTPSQRQGIRFVLIDRLDIPRKNAMDTPLRPQDRRHPGLISADTDVLYLSTSGSTGRPHVVSRTHENIISGAGNVAKALEITSQDRFLSVTPFFHANGFSNCMFLPLSKGAVIVPVKHFSPREVLSLLAEKNITVFFGSPFIFSTLTDVAEGAYFPSLRFCLSTGARLTEGLKKAFLDKFNVKLRQLYGSSETGTVSIEVGDHPGEGSVGTPLDNVQVKIIDDAGSELPPSERGEIIVRGPATMKGYAGEPELNREAFLDGYFRTGDLGLRDDHGSLFIVGRRKKFINASGVKVDPVEIETVLLSFPKVREARVAGITTDRGTEIIKATLVTQKDCSVQEVIRHCRGRLADFKIPRIIELKDSIPGQSAGKGIIY